MLPTPNKLSLFFVLFITMIGMNAAAQTYKFEYFTEYHGLPTKFIYTVDQDMNGYLITGTDKGLYRYDGFEFTKINHHDSLVNPFILCSYMDNEGVIWFGHQDGTVSRYLNGDWSSVPMADDEKSRVNDIGADDNGNVWFLTLDQGLKWIDSEDKIHAYNLDLSDYFIYSMQLDGEYIWLGADVGLLKCDISGQSDVEYVDDVQGQVFDISKFGDELLVATDDRGVYALHESRTGMSVRSIQCGDDNLEDYTIQHIHRDKNNSMWLGTKRSGLLEFRFDQQGNCIKKISYNEGGLEGSTSVGQSFHDREGNLWIATEDNGLIRLLNDYFSFYRLTEFEELDEIQANIVYPTGDNELWIGTESNVVRCEISPWRIIEVYDVQDGLKEANYLSVCSDDQGTVWVGNGLGQLFFKRADEEKFTEFELVRNAEGKFINDIVFNKGRVFVASSIGVFVIQDFELINHFTMSDGLPHDWVSDISIDKKGYLWFSTRSRFLSYYVVGDSEIILEDDVTYFSTESRKEFGDSFWW